MRAGMQVWYWRGGASPVEPATVTAVGGSGPLGYKLLDLRIGAKTLTGVQHITETAGGAGWRLDAPEAPPPRRAWTSPKAKDTTDERD